MEGDVVAGAARQRRGRCSAQVWLLDKNPPPWEVFVFNGIVFGAFLIGFFVTGHFDHKVRLGLRGPGT